MLLRTLTNTLFIGKVLLQYDKLDSTNEYALNLSAKNKPSEGTVISARNQLQGRGQIGRAWSSEAGKNLTFSIIFYPKSIVARQQFILNQAISLGVRDYIATHLNEVWIKWPNDIYVQNRKICGILIQNVLSGINIQTSIVGIGLNVNQATFASHLPNPTSMAMELATELDLDQVLASICASIEGRYLQLRSSNYETIKNDYLHALYRFQEPALYRYPEGATFSGTIVGVSESGKLRIHHKKGEEQFDVRQVEFIL